MSSQEPIQMISLMHHSMQYSHAEQECVTQISVCSTSCLKCQSVHCSGRLPVQNTYGTTIRARITMTCEMFLHPYMGWNVFMTWASTWLHACQYIALSMYVYMCYGIQSDFYNQHNTQHTGRKLWSCENAYIYMHLAFKELKRPNGNKKNCTMAASRSII